MKSKVSKMNIDKIIANTMQYIYIYIYIHRYSDRVENVLNETRLDFYWFEKCLKVGSSKFGKSDSGFKSYFGNDAKIPKHQKKCLCGHEITQQCYLCPEGSTNFEDIIIVGNQCTTKWGYDPAIRGKGAKVKCECCGVTVTKSGINRHQETLKCRNRRDTESNASTCVGSEEWVKLTYLYVLFDWLVEFYIKEMAHYN